MRQPDHPRSSGSRVRVDLPADGTVALHRERAEKARTEIEAESTVAQDGQEGNPPRVLIRRRPGCVLSSVVAA